MKNDKRAKQIKAALQHIVEEVTNTFEVAGLAISIIDIDEETGDSKGYVSLAVHDVLCSKHSVEILENLKDTISASTDKSINQFKEDPDYTNCEEDEEEDTQETLYPTESAILKEYYKNKPHIFEGMPLSVWNEIDKASPRNQRNMLELLEVVVDITRH